MLVTKGKACWSLPQNVAYTSFYVFNSNQFKIQSVVDLDTFYGQKCYNLLGKESDSCL